MRKDALLLGALALAAVGIAAVLMLRQSRARPLGVVTTTRIARERAGALIEVPGEVIRLSPPAPTPEPTMPPTIESAVYDRPVPTEPPPGTPAPGTAGPESNVTPPVLVSKVEPIYPESARKARMEGVAVIEAEVTDQGEVREARIVRSLNPLLDEAALTAVRQWKYRPATLDGKPVRVYLTVTATFSLH